MLLLTAQRKPTQVCLESPPRQAVRLACLESGLLQGATSVPCTLRAQPAWPWGGRLAVSWKSPDPGKQEQDPQLWPPSPAPRLKAIKEPGLRSADGPHLKLRGGGVPEGQRKAWGAAGRGPPSGAAGLPTPCRLGSGTAAGTRRPSQQTDAQRPEGRAGPSRPPAGPCLCRRGPCSAGGG